MSKYIFLTTLALSVLLFSCTERYNVELDGSSPRLVVDGMITTDTTQHLVKLFKSDAYFSNKPLQAVSNANVTISDGEHEFQLQEDAVNKGYYFTDANVYGLPGKTYTLNINNVDINNDQVNETYTASCRLNGSNKLDSIKVDFIHKFYQDNYQISIFGQDPGETRDIYMYKIRINKHLVTDTITEAQFADDEFFNGSYAAYQPVYYLTPTKTDEKLVVGDTVTLEQYGVTKDYQDFWFELMSESYGSDPFGGQPANIVTNVEDKKHSYGYFAAFSLSRINYIIKESDLVLKK